MVKLEAHGGEFGGTDTIRDKIKLCSEAGMVMSRELTCLRHDEDTLGRLLPGMICPTMTCLKRTRVTTRTWPGDGMAMLMVETTTTDGGVDRGTTTVNARIDGLSEAITTRTITLSTQAIPGTGRAGTTMTRTRDATSDAGRGRIRNMSAMAGHGVGGAAGPIPDRRPATPEVRATRSFSRASPATSP